MDEIKEAPQVDKGKLRGVEGLGTQEPVNYGKILGDARTIFISDDHTSFSVKNAFKNALTELSQLGITDLALEMLPKGFDTTNEAAVTAYFHENWDKNSGMAEKYKELFDYAKSLGLRVWGLDIPAEAYQARPPADTFFQRNQQWADLIEDHLNTNPGTKIVVFNGSAHTGYYPAADRTNNLLDKKGHKSVVVNYWGGDKNSQFVPEEKLIGKYVQDNNVENSEFMLRVPVASRTSDYIIYVGKPNALVA